MKLFLFHTGGRKIVHAGSLNGTETANKVNREVALQVESAAAYDYLRAMFEYDWSFQPRVDLPLLAHNAVAPATHRSSASRCGRMQTIARMIL